MDQSYSGNTAARKCSIKMSDRRKKPEASEKWRRQKVCTQEAVNPKSKRDLGKMAAESRDLMNQHRDWFLGGVNQEYLVAGRMKICIICSSFVDGWPLSFIISAG